MIRRVLPAPPAAHAAERALPNPGAPAPANPLAPPGLAPPPATKDAPAAAAPSYVNQAFSEALERSRHQWTFNLLIAFGTAGLIVAGAVITVIWLFSGQANLLMMLFGPGATLLGIANWLLTRPSRQLSQADNQISLLTLVWTNYAQELRSCGAITDPTAAAECTGHAGADAVHYFNEILSNGRVANDPS
jgi:hypothetical protein